MKNFWLKNFWVQGKFKTSRVRIVQQEAIEFRNLKIVLFISQKQK